MIEANELRIGNWIYAGGSVPAMITAKGILEYSEGRGDIRPIPLSPAILEAAGFVKENMFATTFVTYTHDEVEGWFDLYFETHTVRFGIADYEVTNCRYLHQLQNLFYSLCQTELPITLP